MTIPTPVLMKLATMGLSHEVASEIAEMLSAVEAATRADAESGIESSRAKARARFHKWKASHPDANVSKRSQTLANGSRGGDARVEDKTSNLDIEPQEQEERNARKRASHTPEFDAFWRRYPNKVGKPKAAKSFETALRKAPVETILAGLDRYIATKPPEREWLNPATFLNQERWADQPATVTPLARGSPSKLAPVDHFRNLASELNGQDRSDRGIGGNWDDAPRIPIRTIEHHG